MLLPNKLYSFEQSSLALIPKVLKLIERQTLILKWKQNGSNAWRT